MRKFALNGRLARAHIFIRTTADTMQFEKRRKNDRKRGENRAQSRAQTIGNKKSAPPRSESHNKRANAHKEMTKRLPRTNYTTIPFPDSRTTSSERVASAAHLIFHFDAEHFIAHIKSVRCSASVCVCVLWEHVHHTNSFAFILCAPFVHMSFITLLLFGEWRNDRIKSRIYVFVCVRADSGTDERISVCAENTVRYGTFNVHRVNVECWMTVVKHWINTANDARHHSDAGTKSKSCSPRHTHTHTSKYF